MGLTGDANKFLKLIEEMQATLCPPSLAIHLSRIDTKANHPHKDIYQADKVYFAVTKKRAFIREARQGEFDYTPETHRISSEQFPSLKYQKPFLPNQILISLRDEIPKLWVLVTNLENGTHHVSTTYRGKAFWKLTDIDGSNIAEFENEAAFIKALEVIKSCEGVDEKDWERFLQQYWDACVVASSVEAIEGSIH
jgi:hypothetical protein